MRIVYVQSGLLLAGSERQGLLQMRWLSEMGHEVVPVLGGHGWIEHEIGATGAGDPVILEDFIHDQERDDPPWELARGVVQNFRRWLRLKRRVHEIARARRAEVIFANSTLAWLVASGAARRLTLPLVWRCGITLGSHVERGLVRVCDRLYRPTLVLANCEGVRRQLASLVRCPTYFMPNGVDTERFDPSRVAPRLRHALGLDGDAPVVGMVARLVPEKGFHLLLSALPQIVARVPSAQLLVAGEGPWRARFESQFRAQGLGARVRFLGFLPNIEELYRSSDVVILPSRAGSREASSNAILEALAMERPVVATRVGDIAALVHDGRHGFVVPDGDAALLADRVSALLEDPVLRRRLGSAGRAAVLDRHSEARSGELLAAILRERFGDRAPLDSRCAVSAGS
jgi:glycosyltransferase involved in cell wall biosynthesis